MVTEISFMYGILCARHHKYYFFIAHSADLQVIQVVLEPAILCRFVKLSECKMSQLITEVM